MRQVSGLAPQPVADNIIGLNLTYDTCDGITGGPTCAALADPIASGFAPSAIHKANIQVIGQGIHSGKQISQHGAGEFSQHPQFEL